MLSVVYLIYGRHIYTWVSEIFRVVLMILRIKMLLLQYANAKYLNTQCWTKHVACVWPPGYDVLRNVGCYWLKFENGQIWANNIQHVATCRNRVAKRTQHVAPNNVAICCVGMLRSFGRGFVKILNLLNNSNLPSESSHDLNLVETSGMQTREPNLSIVFMAETVLKVGKEAEWVYSH